MEPRDEVRVGVLMTRADESVTRGIESEIESCHLLSGPRRALEFSLFLAIYLAGAAMLMVGSGTSPFGIVGILMMGVAMNSLGILIHEGLHGLLSRSPQINHVLGFLCGLPLLISASAYRATHSDHHFEFGRKRDYGTYRQHLGNRHLVWAAYFSQLFLGSILYIVLIPFLAWKSARGRARIQILVEYALIASVVAVVLRAVSVESLLLFWGYPALVMMLLTNIRGLSSHALGDLEDIYLSSRTVKASRFVEILFLHENFHLEHHLFPQVPSYNLKRIHRLVWSRLPRALYADSYMGFLNGFFAAALKLDLSPCGVVFPKEGGEGK